MFGSLVAPVKPRFDTAISGRRRKSGPNCDLRGAGPAGCIGVAKPPHPCQRIASAPLSPKKRELNVVAISVRPSPFRSASRRRRYRAGSAGGVIRLCPRFHRLSRDHRDHRTFRSRRHIRAAVGVEIANGRNQPGSECIVDPGANPPASPGAAACRIPVDDAGQVDHRDRDRDGACRFVRWHSRPSARPPPANPSAPKSC